MLTFNLTKGYAENSARVKHDDNDDDKDDDGRRQLLAEELKN